MLQPHEKQFLKKSHNYHKNTKQPLDCAYVLRVSLFAHKYIDTRELVLRISKTEINGSSTK